MENKIVIINQSSDFLDVDVLNVASNKYDEVELICGELLPGVRQLNPKVKVKMICKYNRNSGVKRILTWAWGSIQIITKLLLRYRGWHVLYYTNPPMAKFGALLMDNKFRIMEYDIYPDALRTVGIKESSIVYQLWGCLNRKVFLKADKVLTLSEGMKMALCKYVDADKIKVVPLWSASEDFKPVDKAINPFIKSKDLDGKFIVMYSGNIGYTHSVEVLVDVARMMKDVDDVIFLIIGEGKKKAELQKIVADECLHNVRFMPYQDFDVLPYSLASADLGVITLDENVAQVSVPSKSFNLMAVGAPLLAIANEETEMFRLISKYNNGRCIPKSDVGQIVEYIMELKDNPSTLEEYRNNSLKASRDFTYKNAEMYFEYTYDKRRTMGGVHQ